MGMRATADRWRRYQQFFRHTRTRMVTQWRFWNNHPTAAPAFLIANAQLVEFETAQAAIEYLRSHRYAPGSEIPRVYLVDESNASPLVTIAAATDNGRIFSNALAGAACEWDLPPAAPGQRYTFIRMASFDMDVDPYGTDYFRPHGRVGAYLRLDTDGDTVTVQCFTPGVWDIVAGYGTYAFEP